LAEIIGFRMLMIAAGYEDGNDADVLRRDVGLSSTHPAPPDSDGARGSRSP